MQRKVHEHPLVKVNPNVIYQQFQGRWTCDGCRTSHGSAELPYHCSLCIYDLCENCFNGHQHPRHPHALFYSCMENVYPEFGGGWKCDHCGRNKMQLQQSYGYHCPIDKFDLCQDCFHGKNHPIHIHKLKLADSVVEYGNSTGMWQCDSCKKNGREIRSQFPWHCSQCNFDACDKCLKDYNLRLHQHPLKITDSRVSYHDYHGVWKCDMCSSVGSQEIPDMDRSFHCAFCRYDICLSCVKRHNGWPGDGFDVPIIEPVPPVLPEIIPGDDEEEPDETQRCVVCMVRRKNATIVHGATGHICCCIQCALTLRSKRDKCPICRAPIDNVIRHYTS